MSSDAAPKLPMSYAEFIVFEEQSLTKHEWLDGVVYDMSGGTIDHAGLSANVIGILRNQLKGKRCRVFSSDLAVRSIATRLYTYADITVACGSLETDPDNKRAVINPRVVIEVLSDSTEEYDRSGKFAHYKRIASLAEYVLVSQTEKCIEVFRRISADEWDTESEKLWPGKPLR
jgi:Uma2 family endonuclease